MQNAERRANARISPTKMLLHSLMCLLNTLGLSAFLFIVGVPGGEGRRAGEGVAWRPSTETFFLAICLWLFIYSINKHCPAPSTHICPHILWSLPALSSALYFPLSYPPSGHWKCSWDSTSPGSLPWLSQTDVRSLQQTPCVSFYPCHCWFNCLCY